MTISTQTSTVTFSGNGVTTTFTFPFVGDSASTLQVQYTDASGNITTLPSTSYTLSLNAPASGQLWGIGGTVTYPLTGPAISAGTLLTVTRIVPYEQTVTLTNQGPLYPQTMEQGLDLLELQIQQIETAQEYSIQAPVSDINPPSVLPSSASRASKFLFFDTQGNPTAVAGPISPLPPIIGSNTDLVFLSGQTSLAVADALATSLKGTLIIDQNYTLTGATTLSSPNLVFTGGVITLGNFNLTFSNNSLRAGAVPTFSYTGTGKTVGSFHVSEIYPEWWGAKSDGTSTAATLAAFQAANDYVAQSNVTTQVIRLVGNNYNLGSGTTGVVKAASFAAPQWIGSGDCTNFVGTTVTFTPSAEAAAFQFIGGSGSDCGGCVKSIIFQGNSNAIAVESQGLGGLEIEIAVFTPMKRAVLLHNKLSGQFTEFNEIHVNSNGTPGLPTILEYRVDSGNASFHGSGLVGGVINWDGGSGNPAILIGAGAFPYNAPLSATFFPASGASVIVQNNASTGFGESWFYGNLRVEQGGASSVAYGAGGNDFILIGNVMCLGNANSQSNGNMYLANSYQSNSSSLGTVGFKPIYRSGNVSGTTTYPWPANCQNQSWKVCINVFGANYSVYASADLVLNNANGNFTVVNIQQIDFNNTAGYGNLNIPTVNSTGISFSASVTPWPSSGLVYTIGLTQIDQSPSFHNV